MPSALKRALAVIVVLIHHMDETWLKGAFVGVDVFFVISGYVVSCSMLRKPAPTWRIPASCA